MYISYKLERVRSKFLKYVTFVIIEDCLPYDYSSKLPSKNVSILSVRECWLIYNFYKN